MEQIQNKRDYRLLLDPLLQLAVAFLVYALIIMIPLFLLTEFQAYYLDEFIPVIVAGLLAKRNPFLPIIIFCWSIYFYIAIILYRIAGSFNVEQFFIWPWIIITLCAPYVSWITYCLKKRFFVKMSSAIHVFFAILTIIVLSLEVADYYLPDGLGGWIRGRAVHDQTIFAPGYTDKGFRQIKKGMSEERVLAILGQPIEKSLSYHKQGSIIFKNNAVTVLCCPEGPLSKIIAKGMNEEQVKSILGKPESEFWDYAKKESTRSMRFRTITIESGQVSMKSREFIVWNKKE